MTINYSIQHVSIIQYYTPEWFADKPCKAIKESRINCYKLYNKTHYEYLVLDPEYLLLPSIQSRLASGAKKEWTHKIQEQSKEGFY